MVRIIPTALLAVALAAGAAQAQQTPNGTTSGGPGRIGIPGQIVPQQRAYLRDYVAREAIAPTTYGERLVVGAPIPGTVELRSFPDTVYTEVPTARGYRYFSTGRNVVLVDPATRNVIEVIE